MKLIFFGPQGSGKGTQASIIAKKLGIVHISMGDLLRNVQGSLKKEVNEILNQGKLVPLPLTLKILKERLSKPDCKKGFILDGFPRNLEQAHALNKIVRIDKAIEISISEEESISRLSSRLNCPNCKAVFNKITNPPKVPNQCDSCQSKLIQRKDDTPEAIKQRLVIYHKETEPLLKHYKSIKINGEQEIEKVTEDILKAL